MATILAKIKRYVRSGHAEIEGHALIELRNDGFTAADAKHAILSAAEFEELTGDPSHIRYVLYGEASDGRPLNIVVFFQGRSVKIKTAYEPG